MRVVSSSYLVPSAERRMPIHLSPLPEREHNLENSGKWYEMQESVSRCSVDMLFPSISFCFSTFFSWGRRPACLSFS